jgi:hypothetical protein
MGSVDNLTGSIDPMVREEFFIEIGRQKKSRDAARLSFQAHYCT